LYLSPWNTSRSAKTSALSFAPSVHDPRELPKSGARKLPLLPSRLTRRRLCPSVGGFCTPPLLLVTAFGTVLFERGHATAAGCLASSSVRGHGPAPWVARRTRPTWRDALI